MAKLRDTIANVVSVFGLLAIILLALVLISLYHPYVYWVNTHRLLIGLFFLGNALLIVLLKAPEIIRFHNQTPH